MTIRVIHSILEFYYSPGPLYIFVFLFFLTSINSRFTTSDNSKQNIGRVRHKWARWSVGPGPGGPLARGPVVRWPQRLRETALPESGGPWLQASHDSQDAGAGRISRRSGPGGPLAAGGWSPGKTRRTVRRHEANGRYEANG